MNAFQVLQKMTLSKSMTETVRRAIRVRLIVLLETELKCYKHWKDNIQHNLNRTRQKQIDREYKKRIQAAKIVIHWLTPFWERTEDVPTFVVRKDKKP